MYKNLKNKEIEFIFYNDVNYPEILKEIANPPIGFFKKGNIPDLSNSIAIVGARKASDYGKTTAYNIAYELAKRDITIISGMARGIDTSAHKGAIDANGNTIAVLGSGFDNIYPAENYGLSETISEHGCLITEYLPNVKPLSYNFPERNRIISGLAQKILVIEAGERSGSLITAGFALEQGKDVFAVPGNIFSPYSKGTNNLIKDGAKLISNIEDILEEYNLKKEDYKIKNLDEVEKEIVNILKSGAVSLEYLIENINYEMKLTLSTLSKLECKKIIKKTYGNYYILY
ncbi:DNA-processing protein DprA [Fervidicella metallireducens]|uniref:DNA-processing protein DprA n=1 Tax=Fervidicella metallireducens TaxID=655338 RepID=UPI000A079F4D|nr:DNA-processing protein DprA [Fervidicella metallireducens]